MNDPFADDEKTDDVADFVPTEKPSVAPSENGKLVLTIKGGTGFDAPWLVFHTDGIEDAHEQLFDPTLPALMEKAAKASKYFAKMHQGASQPPSGGQQQNGKPAGATEAPGGAKKFCSHGEMAFKSGVSKTSGKAYQGFFCTERDRDAQCKPEFIN